MRMEQSMQTLILILAALGAGVWISYRFDPMNLLSMKSKQDQI